MIAFALFVPLCGPTSFILTVLGNNSWLLSIQTPPPRGVSSRNSHIAAWSTQGQRL